MLKLAICDDQIEEINHIFSLLKNYQITQEPPLQVHTFHSSLELLETIKSGMYDILLLDILMPGTNGIEVAKEIRDFDKSVKIIFLTSSPEYAVDSYSVDAYYYLLKPTNEQILFPLLDRIHQQYFKSKDYLMIKHFSGIIRLEFDDIEFLEVMNKKLYFHQVNGHTLETKGSLSDYEDQLLHMNSFIKIHRSYIINMEFIKELNSSSLTTRSGVTLSISRLLHVKVKETYLNYIFSENKNSVL